MTQLPPHSVTDLLVLSYVQLRDAWVKAHQVQDCSTDAPWHQWRDVPEDAPITLRDVLMDFGEKSGSLAARAEGQHLDLLARAYWLDPAAPDGPEWDRWPYAAAYGPARAILESAALAGWLLDPDPDPDERALRGARLALWSRAIDWEDDLRSAGFDVRRNDNDTPYVWSDGSSRPLSLSALVRYVFSRRGTRLYGRWSKQLHNDPVAIAPRSTLASRGRRPAPGFDNSGRRAHRAGGRRR